MNVCTACGQIINLWFHVGCPVGPGCPEGFDPEVQWNQIADLTFDLDETKIELEDEKSDNKRLRRVVKSQINDTKVLKKTLRHLEDLTNYIVLERSGIR